MAQPDDRYLVVGQIVSAYGVNGWVKIRSYTSPQQNILQYNTWYLAHNDHWKIAELVASQRHGKGIVASFSNHLDRDAALLLRGIDIAIQRCDLPPLTRDEYYWADLIGLRVVNHLGLEMGVVVSLLETGANDVLVVAGERERLIPYINHQVIKGVDLAQGVLQVEWDAEF